MKVLLTGIALLGLTACRDSVAPNAEPVRVIAHLVPPPNTVDLPARIVAGQPFQVTVHTMGGVCAGPKPDGVTVDQVGSVTRIVPYDLVQTGDEPADDQVQCMVIPVYLRTVNLVLSTPGPATIRVIGAQGSVDFEVTVEP